MNCLIKRLCCNIFRGTTEVISYLIDLIEIATFIAVELAMINED